MTTLKALDRIPDNLDYAAASQFRFSINRLPEVEYFVTKANLPTITLTGDAKIGTPFKDIFLAGDTVEYSDLSIEFLVNETYENWEEVYKWIIGIGFPTERKQFGEMISGNDATQPSGGISPMFSDATLTILSNKNNPLLQVVFRSLFPTELTGVEFNTQETDVSNLTATATFKFTDFEIRRL